MQDDELKPGISGVIEIKRADGSVQKLRLTSKDLNKETQGENANGNTRTSRSDSKSDR
jgi:hypothetical protein